MALRKGKEKKAAQVINFSPQEAEGENVFGVCHIVASFNKAFVHDTDLSGKETICHVIDGMKLKADRDESSPYAAMLAAQDVAQRCKELGIIALHIKLRATGGNRTKTPGPGAQSVLRALTRSGIKSGQIEDVTVSPLTAPGREGPAWGGGAGAEGRRKPWLAVFAYFWGLGASPKVRSKLSVWQDEAVEREDEHAIIHYCRCRCDELNPGAQIIQKYGQQLGTDEFGLSITFNLMGLIVSLYNLFY